jgi:FkbM family methyltransferase
MHAPDQPNGTGQDWPPQRAAAARRHMTRRLPLAIYTVFRHGAVRLRRGSVVRSLCIAVLKHGCRSYRGRLHEALREVRPLDAPELTLEATDSMVVEAVYWFGVQGYEGKVAEVWTTLCGRARSILEVGGNIGLFATIGGRATTAPYTVLEPIPEVAAILRANLARNGATMVQVIEGAAIPGTEPADVYLNIPNERHAAPVGAHLVIGVEIEQRSRERQIAVHGIPFAALLAGRDLVKIDAEGIEAELLGTCQSLLASLRPSILIEVLPEASRLAALIVQLARDIGYRLYVIPEYGSDEIVQVDPAVFTAGVPGRYRSKDVLLCMSDLRMDGTAIQRLPQPS